MLLKHISVSARFLIVLAIGIIFQAGVSIVSLLDLRESLIQDRTTEVKHLLETAYSVVNFYHDEAIHGHVDDATARRQAADAVRSMHYDGLNYFFIWDLNGTGIAHGARPSLEGHSFINSPDAEKNPVVAYMVRKLLEVANSEKKEGLTSYKIPKAGQTVPLDKIAYSKLFEPWGWSIGTGAYVDDIDDAFYMRSMWVLVRTLLLIAAAGALTFALGRDLSRALTRLSHRVTGVARGQLEGEVQDVDRRDEVGAMARALLLLRDTSREAAELRLDQLTGLPTRKLMMDRLRQVQARSARSGNFGAVMLIDLDKFKLINDTHGHDIGDALLREVAQRLSARVRQGDTVARLGGDEFVVILVDIGRSEAEAAAAAGFVCKKLVDVLQQTYQFGKISFTGAASIGITLVMGDGVSADALLKQADLAMYRAKESGRNLHRFFDPEMEHSVHSRANLEDELRQALEKQQFTLYYQPQIDAANQLVGAEALIRWEHPERGLIPPLEFIGFAEQTGFILPLGQWVLETACKQLAAWASRPEFEKCRVSVNVSARQFQQSNFADQVEAILHSTGANPSLLTLELTESLMIQDPQSAVAKMSELRSKGVNFALDDFGTGFSSLNMLKHLPLNQLKIDRSFTRDILANANDAAIANIIVMLAQTLNLEVVAEGVETTEQEVFLLNCGCQILQGFCFSRPLPADLFEHFALRQRLLATAPHLERRQAAGRVRNGRPPLSLVGETPRTRGRDEALPPDGLHSVEATEESDLYSLAYVSRTNAVEADSERAGVIRDILVAARRTNLRLGVTGALLFSGGYFAQVIEGPRESVEGIFQKIRSDPRHWDVRLLHFRPIDKRDFVNWYMAYAGSLDEAVHALDFGGAYAVQDAAIAGKVGQDLVKILTSQVRLQQSAVAS